MPCTDRSRVPGPAARWVVATPLVVLFLVAPIAAQSFDSGSDGSDGALLLTEPGEIVFDPVSFDPPLDVDGDNVFHFTTIHIGPGVTVRLTTQKLGTLPVVWLADGDIRIDGLVDLSGGRGHDNTAVPAERRPSVPGPGGYAGGVGGRDGSPAEAGRGPGGGSAPPRSSNQLGSNGFGGGFAGSTSFLVPLIGGSGGGGGNFGPGAAWAAGGGAGGGALLLASSSVLHVGGTIQAHGGQGGIGASPGVNFGFGGSGSGGALHLVASRVEGTGQLRAQGGPGFRGGGAGRIRLEAFEQGFRGTVNPTPSFGTPFALFLRSGPSVRVVSIGGVPVPPDPTGSFEMPDATIMEGGDVPVEIEALQVPLSAEVKLHLFSENGPDQVVSAGPLSGTPELSTTSVTLAVPPGFSRGYVRAIWEP